MSIDEKPAMTDEELGIIKKRLGTYEALISKSQYDHDVRRLLEEIERLRNLLNEKR